MSSEHRSSGTMKHVVYTGESEISVEARVTDGEAKIQ
jgi:hypothetical protein